MSEEAIEIAFGVLAQMLILIPPLSQNLAAFAAWSRSAVQHACLLAHHCTGCMKVQHKAGQTLFIPGVSSCLDASMRDLVVCMLHCITCMPALMTKDSTMMTGAVMAGTFVCKHMESESYVKGPECF